MKEIIRNRVIRPSTRQEQSKTYKINTEFVSKEDALIVNIGHEGNLFNGTYRFNGADVENKDSIRFRVDEESGRIKIKWYGAKPIEEIAPFKKRALSKPIVQEVIQSLNLTESKTSFESISDANTSVLI